MMRTLRICCFLLLILVLGAASGCALFRPDAGLAQKSVERLVPEEYTVADPDAVPLTAWWQDFNDAELNRLMGLALTQNFTVVQAEARMRQAEALAVQAGAALWPSVSLTGESSFTRQHAGTPAVEGADRDTDIESYSLGGVAASYELDLWGRVRSTRNSARNAYVASRYDLETAWMSISAEIAGQWFQLQSARAQLDLLKGQLETNHKLVELLQLRQRNGQATGLDVAQQRQATAATASAIPVLESAIGVLSNQLNVLVGEPLATEIGSSTDEFPDLPPLPDTGLPADLLTNRPDIRAAGVRLEAAGWDVAAAKADRLPAVRLTASASWQSDELSDLFDNWLANLAAGFTAPLLDGGRRRAEVSRTRAVQDERLSAYRETVLQALADVENALIREDRQAATLDTLQEELDFARTALREARTRYRNGSIDYLNVLSSLTSVQRLEQELISGRQQLYSERIGLIRALGGSWTRAPLDPEWNQPEESP